MFNAKDFSLLKRLDIVNVDEDLRDRVLQFAKRKVVSLERLKEKAIEAQLITDGRKLGVKWNS